MLWVMVSADVCERKVEGKNGMSLGVSIFVVVNGRQRKRVSDELGFVVVLGIEGEGLYHLFSGERVRCGTRLRVLQANLSAQL